MTKRRTRHNTPEQQRIKKLLRQLRKENEMTQKALGELIGRYQSYISKCEQGERRVDVTEVAEICGAFGMSLTEFAELYESSKGPPWPW